MNDHPPKVKAPGTVLFIGFWGLDDPLTASSLLPGARTLLERFGTERVILATVERGSAPPSLRLPEGIQHVPLHASTMRPKVLGRTLDHVRMARDLAGLVRREKVGLIMARTANAGGLAHRVHRRTGVPYIVESFEPHAEYMADCGEWSRWGPLYRAARWLERAQMRAAVGLITVANTYRDRLLREGVPPERLAVAPCPVPLDRFAPDGSVRARIRADLGGADILVGVYAGKFGGLYHRERAFALFAAAHAHFGARFRLVVLTAEPHDAVIASLRASGFPAEHAVVRAVPHAEVPGWLNAADFAFAPYRATPSSAYLSPVKVGEYWACGLPVMLTPGVGDDAAIIAQHTLAGVLHDPERTDHGAAFACMQRVLDDPAHRTLCRSLAERHRTIAHTAAAYARSIDRLTSAGTGR